MKAYLKDYKNKEIQIEYTIFICDNGINFKNISNTDKRCDPYFASVEVSKCSISQAQIAFNFFKAIIEDDIAHQTC